MTIDIQMLRDQSNDISTKLNETKTTLETEVASLRERVVKMEERENKVEPFSPSCTIVATGLRYQADEDVKDKANIFVRDGLGLECGIVDAMRTPFRNNRPGIIKIQFKSKDDKEMAIARKSKLKDSRYKRVFIRSSIPHNERLQFLNMKTLLQATGKTEEFRILKSGRIVSKVEMEKWQQQKSTEGGGDSSHGATQQESNSEY